MTIHSSDVRSLARLPVLLVGGAFLLAGCGGDSPTEPDPDPDPDPVGTVEVTASTTGNDQDDEYTVTVDPGTEDESSQALGANGTVTFEGLPEGDHEVALSDVANNCSVEGENPRTVSVPADGSASTTFEVACTQQTGDLEVSASTSGEDQDEDGYTVEVDGGAQTEAIGVNGTVTITGLAAGSHEVELTGVASNCSVSGDNPRTVDVPEDGTASTTFDVSCSQQVGDLEVTASTSGEDQDDEYTVTVDPGTGDESSQVVGANGTVTFEGLPAGDHEVLLDDVAVNCNVSDNPRTVSVPADGSASTTFEVTCTSATGDLEVSASTTGDDIDGDGYKVLVDPGTAGELEDSIGVDGTATFSDLAEGDHEVLLDDVADNCEVSGDNPRTVTVSFGQTETTQFDVACDPRGSDIVFESIRDGNWEVYVMDADGTLQTNLTQNSATDRLPAWSPDRSQVAFQSNREGSVDIWVMDADGTDATNLTPTLDGTKFVPAWSPDGTEIAFSREDPSGQIDIWVMDADGTNQRQITDLASDDQQARWSPDGSQFVFRTDRDGDTEIYVMDTNGDNPQNLSNDPSLEDGLPTWSPDGSQISWVKHFDSESGNSEIFIMDANGDNPQNLSNHAAVDGHPSFSPDGSQIAFFSDRSGTFNIFVMDSDGNNQTNVSDRPNNNRGPSWRAP